METDDIISAELNFVILNYLAELIEDSTLIHDLENRLLSQRALPIRRDFKGGEHSLSLDELVLHKSRYSHVSSDHLYQIVNTARNKVSPNLSTIMGFGSNSLSGYSRPVSEFPSSQSQISKDNLIAESSPALLDLARPYVPAFNSRTMVSRTLGSRIIPGSLPLKLVSSFSKLNSIQGHKLPVYCITFDRTGQRIFTGSDDCHVKVWSSTTGHLLQTLRGHAAEITDLAIDENNNILASASNDDTVRLWDLQSFKPRGILINHQNSITTVLFCPDPDEHFLLTTTMGGIARVWTVGVPNPAPPRIFDCKGQIWCASWSPGGQRFVTGCGDGICRIWSVNPPQLIQSLVGHRAVPVDSVKWSHTGSKIISGSQDGTSRIWDYSAVEQRWVCLNVIVGDENGLEAPRRRDSIKCTMAVWTRDDAYAIIAFSNAAIKVFNVRLRKVTHEFMEHSKEVFVISPHPRDTRIIMSAGYDGKVCLWNVASGELITSHVDGSSKISDGQFSPCGQYFALSDKDGFFSLYGTRASDLVRSAPVAQFFSTDDNNLRRDPSGYVLDEVLMLPPHLIPRSQVQLCNQYMEPYIDQPNAISFLDPCPLDSAEIEMTRSRRTEMKLLELATFAFSANPVDDNPAPAMSNSRSVRASRRSRGGRRAPLGESNAQIEIDDERMVMDDLMDFLPSSSSSGDESESDSGLIGESRSSLPQRRAGLRPSTVESSQSLRRRYSSEEEDDPHDDDFASGIMTREGRRRFREDSRRSQRQLQRLATSQHRTSRVSKSQDRPEDNVTKAFKIKHKLRVHERLYKTSYNSYPSWLANVYPSSEGSGSYIPQIGDLVVFFKEAGYQRYAEEFLELSDPLQGTRDQVPSSVPAVAKCRVVSIQYQIEPYIHCIIEMVLVPEQYRVSELLPTETVPQESYNHLVAKDLGLSEHRFPTDNPAKIIVRYHPSDLPDFLVLASRFEQSLRRQWKKNEPFRMFYPGPEGERWFRGKVVSVAYEDDNFPWESLQICWDSEDYTEYVSPWEVLHLRSPDDASPEFCKVESIKPSISTAIVEDINAEVSTLPNAKPFLVPVNLHEERKYNSLVPFPIDIGTIVARLNNRYYRSVQHLRFEVGFLAKNVREYDQRNLVLSREAGVIVRLISAIIQKRCDEANPLTSIQPSQLESDLFLEGGENFEDPLHPAPLSLPLESIFHEMISPKVNPTVLDKLNAVEVAVDLDEKKVGNALSSLEDVSLSEEFKNSGEESEEFGSNGESSVEDFNPRRFSSSARSRRGSPSKHRRTQASSRDFPGRKRKRSSSDAKMSPRSKPSLLQRSTKTDSNYEQSEGLTRENEFAKIVRDAAIEARAGRVSRSVSTSFTERISNQEKQIPTLQPVLNGLKLRLHVPSPTGVQADNRNDQGNRSELEVSENGMETESFVDEDSGSVEKVKPSRSKRSRENDSLTSHRPLKRTRHSAFDEHDDVAVTGEEFTPITRRSTRSLSKLQSSSNPKEPPTKSRPQRNKPQRKFNSDEYYED